MTDNNKNNDPLLRLLNALKADWHNKSDYANQVVQTEKVTVITEDGTPIETEHSFFISMDSIGQVLALVLKKADLPDDFGIPSKSQSE